MDEFGEDVVSDVIGPDEMIPTGFFVWFESFPGIVGSDNVSKNGDKDKECH